MHFFYVMIVLKTKISCPRKYLKKKKCIWKICLKKENGIPSPFLLSAFRPSCPPPPAPPSWAAAQPVAGRLPLPLSSPPLTARVRLSASPSPTVHPDFPSLSLSLSSTAKPRPAPPRSSPLLRARIRSGQRAARLLLLPSSPLLASAPIRARAERTTAGTPRPPREAAAPSRLRLPSRR